MAATYYVINDNVPSGFADCVGVEGVVFGTLYGSETTVRFIPDNYAGGDKCVGYNATAASGAKMGIVASAVPGTLKQYNSAGDEVGSWRIDAIYQASTDKTGNRTIFYYNGLLPINFADTSGVLLNPLAFGFQYPKPGWLFINYSWALDLLEIDYDPSETIDPYLGVGTSPLGGESIGVPGLPSIDCVDAGLISVYSPTLDETKALADYLWTNISDEGTLAEVVEAIKREIVNPMSVVLGFSVVPNAGLEIGSTKEQIRAGFGTIPVSMFPVEKQFFEVDCGALKFDPVCADSFLDYSPYSKFTIYLPFIGYQNLDANDCVGHTIGVKYHCDVVTGACVAYITKDGSVQYQFAGSMSLNVPLSSQSWVSTIASVTSTAANIVTGLAVGGAATATVAGAASIASNPSLLAPSVARSGSFSGSQAFLGVMVPYVVREAPTFQSTEGKNSEIGYPLQEVRKLGELKGYTKVGDIHLDGVPATDEELEEIVNLLTGGVIL